MKELDSNIVETCCKKVQPHIGTIRLESYTCGKPATHTNGTHFFCRKHSKMGRYVIREGETGTIFCRSDTEIMIRINFVKFDSSIFQMQKITSSSRQTLYNKMKNTNLKDNEGNEIFVGNVLECDIRKYLVVEENGKFYAVHEPSCCSEREGMKECNRDILADLLEFKEIIKSDIKIVKNCLLIT